MTVLACGPGTPCRLVLQMLGAVLALCLCPTRCQHFRHKLPVSSAAHRLTCMPDEPACAAQMDGFGSDSTRMISLLRKASPDLQLLLFSATFNEAVKNFALRVAGAQANQASHPAFSSHLGGRHTVAARSQKAPALGLHSQLPRLAAQAWAQHIQHGWWRPGLHLYSLAAVSHLHASMRWSQPGSCAQPAPCQGVGALEHAHLNCAAGCRCLCPRRSSPWTSSSSTE